MPGNPEFITVKLPRRLIEAVDKFVKTSIAHKNGIFSRSDFFSRAAVPWLAAFDKEFVPSPPVPSTLSSAITITNFPSQSSTVALSTIQKEKKPSLEEIESEMQKEHSDMIHLKKEAHKTVAVIRNNFERITEEVNEDTAAIEKTGRTINSMTKNQLQDILEKRKKWIYEIEKNREMLHGMGEMLDKARIKHERYIQLQQQMEQELFKEEISSGESIPEWWHENRRREREEDERMWREEHDSYQELIQESNRLEQAKERALKINKIMEQNMKES
jgi:hypothetical protein